MNCSAKLTKSLSVVVAAALFSPLTSVQAGSDSDNFNVLATVAAVCRIDSVTDLDFASITPGTQANYDADATITWRCTNGTVADIDLNGGLTTGDIADRRMTSPSGDLAYQLYTDPARSDLWGDGTTGNLVTVNGAGMGIPSAQTTTIYGRVTDTDAVAAQPDDYADEVTVTITF